MVSFKDGELVKGAYVVIDGKEYEVHMPQYSGETPLSPENLNKMQNDLKDEIKQMNGTVLYENENGTTGDITLSDNYDDYRKFDMYSKEGTIMTCYNNSSTDGCVISYTKPIGVDTVSIQIKAQQIFFKNNNTITRGMGKTIGIGGSGQGVTQNIDENMIITKIVGYK